MPVSVHLCIYVRTYICMYICTCTNFRLYVNLYEFMYVCMYICMYVSTVLTGEPRASFRSRKTALFSLVLVLEARLIGVHCKKRYINVWIQYNTIQYNTIQYNTIQYNTIQYIIIIIMGGFVCAVSTASNTSGC